MIKYVMLSLLGASLLVAQPTPGPVSVQTSPYLRITPELKTTFIRETIGTNPFRVQVRRPTVAPVARNVDSLRDQVEAFFGPDSIGGVIAGPNVAVPQIIHRGRIYSLDEVITPRAGREGYGLEGLRLQIRDISPRHLVIEVVDLNFMSETENPSEVRRIQVSLDEYFHPSGG